MAKNVENIGARRLHTIMEKFLEEISFNSTTLEDKHVVGDQKYVEEQLSNISMNEDLSKFIL